MCIVFSCLRTMVRLPGLGIFKVYTGVDACDCTRGCADTAGESALTVDCGRKIPCCTGDSNPHRAVLLLAFPSDALPTELSSLVSGLFSCVRLPSYHTPSSASGTSLQTLPELVTPAGALFISAELSTDAVSILRKVWVLIIMWKQNE